MSQLLIKRNLNNSIAYSKSKIHSTSSLLKEFQKIFLIMLFLALIFTVWISIYSIPQFKQNAFSNISNHTFSPLQQFKQGIPAKYVNCIEGLQLIIKSSTGIPACMKWDNGKKLLERGWAKSIPMISNYVCDSDCKQKLEKEGYTCYGAVKESNFCTDKFSQRISEVVIPFSANSINGKNYTPNSIKVSIGINNTVRWTNVDIISHTIFSDNKEFRSPLILPNQTWTFTFDKIGDYVYNGELGSPWLHGAVIVLPTDLNFEKGKPIENWGGEPSLGRYLFRDTDALGYVKNVLVLNKNSVMVSLSYPNGTEQKEIKLGDQFIGICSKHDDFITVRTFVLERVDMEQKIVQFREEIQLINSNCNKIFN